MTIEEPDAGPRPVDLPHRREFLGHPVGLPVIAFTEAFERFSYYGMQTLLVLYMVKALLLTPHVERIAGFGWFSNVMAGIYGAPPNTQALASHIFGTYTMLVYVTPILGGLLADRWLGKTLTVTIGALLMAAGHFLMAFDVSFLLALLLLVLGVGCLKGNLASQVGALYAPGDGRATDAFQIYYIGISFGAFFAPLVCGALGEEVGWHWGFGAAGVGMVIGLVIYLTGQRHLPPDPLTERRAGNAAAVPRRAMTQRDIVVLVVLLFMIPVLAVSAIGNQQMFNAYLVWADRSYEFMLFGHRMPTSFLVSFDAFTGFVTLAGAVAFWRWYARHWREPDEMTKLIIGCLISSSAFLLVMIVASRHEATGAKPALWVALAVNTLNNLGFANVFPVSLALYSRAAPRAIAGTVVGIYYLFLALANYLVGVVGGWLDIMPAGQFWGIHVGAILGAAAVFVAIKIVFGRLLLPELAPAASLAASHQQNAKMSAVESLARFGISPREQDLPQIRSLLAEEARRERAHEAREEDLAYLCCAQLFAAGHVEDSLPIWAAKQSGFDMSVVVDVQSLCGAGLEETKQFLQTSPDPAALDVLDYIRSCEATGDFAGFSPPTWLDHYKRYFGVETT